MKFRLAFVALAIPAALLALPQSTSWPFGGWQRASEAPIVSRQGTTWESAGTFNPAVMMRNGKFVMLYRAQDGAGTSSLGYAERNDGIHFTRRAAPVLSPETAYEKHG